MDTNFESLLNQTQQDFDKAEVRNDWMPEDGEYIAMLSDTSTGDFVDDSTGTRHWYIALEAKILDDANPELDQRVFRVGFYSNKYQAGLASLKAVGAVLLGRDPKASGPITEYVQALIDGAASSKIVRVKVWTSKKGYQNVDVLEVVGEENAEAS